MKSSKPLFSLLCLACYFKYVLATFCPRPKSIINNRLIRERPINENVNHHNAAVPLTATEENDNDFSLKQESQKEEGCWYNRCLTTRGGADSLTSNKNETNPFLNLLMHPYLWYVGAVVLITLNFLGDHDTSKSVFCYLIFLLVVSETANILSEAAKQIEKNRKQNVTGNYFTKIRGGGVMSIGMTFFTTAIHNPILVLLILGVTTVNIYEEQVPFGSPIKNIFMYCLAGYFFYLLVQWQKLQQFEENRGD